MNVIHTPDSIYYLHVISLTQGQEQAYLQRTDFFNIVKQKTIITCSIYRLFNKFSFLRQSYRKLSINNRILFYKS